VLLIASSQDDGKPLGCKLSDDLETKTPVGTTHQGNPLTPSHDFLSFRKVTTMPSSGLQIGITIVRPLPSALPFATVNALSTVHAPPQGGKI
jgi:hypothetical protein